MKLTGAQILWESLVREGVTEVFGYPGGAILPAYDALLDFPIRHTLVRHEQGATHMADGYARASGGVGVAIATSGPGATNMVTGIATAMLDSSPIVCITGQVGSRLIGSDAFQEIDITGITLPITKHNYLVTRAEDIAKTVREAFVIAKAGRPGPVLIDITKDAQQASCIFDWCAAAPAIPGWRHAHPIGQEQLGHAAALLNTAERPVLLAGHGVLISGAMDHVRQLAESAHIPVAMTLLGIGGFPASHPLNLGMMGMHGEAWVNTAIQEADLLIACGMRFDDRVTGNLKTYATHAKKIHIDIDAAEINKNVPVDVGLVGDLRDVLERLLPAIAFNERTAWAERIASVRGDSAVRDIQQLPDDGHLYAAHVINDLWRATSPDRRSPALQGCPPDRLRQGYGESAEALRAKADTIVVTDVGQHQMWEAQYYHHDAPRSLITSGGLGTMGFAVPAAIGAKRARPDAEVWAVVGDGGFQMTMCELATAVQERLAIKVAIINNGFLGMVRQWQEFFYERRYAATPLSGPDFVKLAESFGIRASAVSTRGEVLPAIADARAHDGPVVIDFRVEQEDTVYPMVPAGADLGAMIRRPNPIAETAADETDRGSGLSDQGFGVRN